MMKKLKIALSASILISLANNSKAGVGIAELHTEITNDIQKQLQLNEVEVKFNGYTNIGEFTLEDLALDAKRHKFRAQILTSGHSQTLMGAFSYSITLPVLKHSASKGQKISKHDIEYTKSNSTKLRENVIMEEKYLLNKELKSNHSAGKPFYPKDLRAETIIKKGNLLEMQFNTRHLHIETKAIAIEDGAYGETIKVKNINSGKLIHAKVMGAGIVVIGE